MNDTIELHVAGSSREMILNAAYLPPADDSLGQGEKHSIGGAPVDVVMVGHHEVAHRGRVVLAVE
jgi:hypothetical protein